MLCLCIFIFSLLIFRPPSSSPPARAALIWSWGSSSLSSLGDVGEVGLVLFELHPVDERRQLLHLVPGASVVAAQVLGQLLRGAMVEEESWRQLRGDVWCVCVCVCVCAWSRCVCVCVCGLLETVDLKSA